MSTSNQMYYRLMIEGRLNVVPVTLEELKGQRLFVFILMGPIGSGKSAFVESLSPDRDLNISKDTLESVTQNVACYRVLKLTDEPGRSYVLVDTPGFLDTKLSESRITKMIVRTLHSLQPQSGPFPYVAILYFQPITDIRLGGSKRDAVKLLREFAASFNASEVSVVTTMWNNLSGTKQIQDANHRFNSLEKEIFVSSDNLRMSVVRFEFSTESALSILDTEYGWHHHKSKSHKSEPQYQPLILNNLFNRITNTQQQLLNLAEEKQNATTPGREDPRLLDVVLRDEKVSLAALQDFLDDLYRLDQKAYWAIMPNIHHPHRPPSLLGRFKIFTAPLMGAFARKNQMK